MIEGTVNAGLEPVIRLRLLGPSGQTREVDAIVATGYEGFLTLPPGIVAELGLESSGHAQVVLPDGREMTFESYAVTVLWDGRPLDIGAEISPIGPAVGRSMLAGHHVLIEAERGGGRVVIEAMA